MEWQTHELNNNGIHRNLTSYDIHFTLFPSSRSFLLFTSFMMHTRVYVCLFERFFALSLHLCCLCLHLKEMCARQEALNRSITAESNVFNSSRSWLHLQAHFYTNLCSFFTEVLFCIHYPNTIHKFSMLSVFFSGPLLLLCFDICTLETKNFDLVFFPPPSARKIYLNTSK